MKIYGERIAEEIRGGLKTEILKLKTRSIIPKLAIITLGPESSWEKYVEQKLKVARELGVKTVLLTLFEAKEEPLLKTIWDIDEDPKYHGIIVQRPMPENISKEKVIKAISPEKDVDGFRADSNFEVPVWLAVRDLINKSLEELNIKKNWTELEFAVIGKGETAGGPVTKGLKKLGIEPKVIDSKTPDAGKILKNADIIISCVGKRGIIGPEQIKKGSILIGVGTHGEDGKIRGDYIGKEIEHIAGAYTPTPGGVGPVNLSYLFKNLVEAAKK